MPLLERASSPRRIGVWSLVGLVLVPLLVAAGFLWATWDSTDRLDRVQAAVVNLDEPVKIGKQTVPLGRQLAGGLVTGGEDTADGKNFDWVLTDADDATSGLQSGQYAAVVTIPEDFSARATSYSKTDAKDISAATLDVRTSEAGGVIDPVVGQAIATAATRTLNSELTKSYLENIYVGFNDLGKQFQTVATAAGKLADGSSQVSGGLDATADGSAQLADGLDQLADGAGQLATGTAQTSTGTRQLADGLDKLADGTAKLPPAARQLADGTAASAKGADQLADGGAGLAGGLTSLRKGTAAQPGGTRAFAAGVQQYADGVGQYRDTFVGITKLTDAQLVERFPQLCPAPATVEQCGPVLQGFRGGITATLAGFSNTKDQSGKTVPGLVPSAQQLATGAAGIDGGVGKLASGASGLASGQRSLAGGLDKLADGSDQFADGLKPLAKGVRSTATGADQLADGVAQLSTGVTQLAGGTRQSADGAGDLSGGVRKLADASSKLSDGTQQLADGLAKGADAVPSYDKQTRQKLAPVVANPVDTPAPTSAFSNVTTTTLLAVLALWVGALATYLVLRPVTARVLASSKPSWRLSLEGLLPGALIGAVQALALTVVMHLLLDLPAGRTLQLGGLALLTAVTFAALNQALVAWFGGVGRFVSVALVVLATAGALTAAVPAAFATVEGFLPLQPALDAFRAVAGNLPGAGAGAALLGAWLLIGLVASVVAVTRRRILRPVAGTALAT